MKKLIVSVTVLSIIFAGVPGPVIIAQPLPAISSSAFLTWKSFIRQELIPNEAKYFSTRIGVDPKSGMPLDHVRIRLENEMLSETGNYTAASKISLAIPYLLGVIQQKEDFQGVMISPKEAEDLLHKSLLTIKRFMKEYKHYGGFLPWIDIRPDGNIAPANNKVPSLDNGQLTWALAAVTGALEKSQNSNLRELAKLAEEINRDRNYAKFYDSEKGLLHGTVQVDESSGVWHGDKTYYLNDMCEGIMAILWGVLHGQIPQSAWENVQIQTRDYKTLNGEEATTFLGFRASFHEHWALAYLPFMETSLASLYKNYLYVQADYARRNGLPGFVSTAYDPRGVYRQMGIPAIAGQKVDRSDVAVVFATAMSMLIEPETGAAWLKNLYDFPNVVTRYGAVESVGNDGYADIFTADGKGLTLLAASGGVVEEVEQYLKTRNVPGENITMYDKFIQLVNSKYEQMMNARDNIPVAIPSLPVPMPSEKQMTVQIKELVQEESEFNVSEHLQPGHLHGRNVKSVGQNSLEDDVRPGQPIGFEYDIPFVEKEDLLKWAFRGTYIDEVVGIAGMNYVSVSVPAEGERMVFDLEFKSDDIFLAYVTIDTGAEGILSADGKWKTVTTKLSVVPDANYKPMNYIAVVVNDERFLRGKYTKKPPLRGTVIVKDILLSMDNPQPKRDRFHGQEIPPVPGDYEVVQYWRPSHGNLYMSRDPDRRVIRFKGGYGWVGGYVPYVDVLPYKHVRIKVRNTSGNYNNGFFLELKHNKIHLLGKKIWIQLKGFHDWHTVRIRIPQNVEQVFNYLAISDPQNDFELSSIVFEYE